MNPHLEIEQRIVACERSLRIGMHFGSYLNSNIRFAMYGIDRIANVTASEDAQAFARFQIWFDHIRPTNRMAS